MPLYKITARRLARKEREDAEGITDLRAELGIESAESDSDESSGSDSEDEDSEVGEDEDSDEEEEEDSEDEGTGCELFFRRGS